MKKLFLVLILTCGCSVNREFVQTSKATWDVIGPEYINYVRNDPELDDYTKQIRIRTAELYGRMIEEAK